MAEAALDFKHCAERHAAALMRLGRNMLTHPGTLLKFISLWATTSSGPKQEQKKLISDDASDASSRSKTTRPQPALLQCIEDVGEAWHTEGPRPFCLVLRCFCGISVPGHLASSLW